MNGPWFSQGELYLSDAGEVALVHPDTGEIGARWAGLAEFLQSEIPRLLGIHDNKGDVLPSASHLPGNTQNWEEQAEHAKRKAAGWGYYVRASFNGSGGGFPERSAPTQLRLTAQAS